MRRYDLTCPGCGVTFEGRGSYMNHARYSSDCTREKRFWGRVNKSAPNGCWEWMGYRQRFGHGWIGLHDGKTQRGVLAHRYAWELLRGPLPADACLLHRCDNPPCVNPDHLFIGDRVANMADSVAKDRHSRGERSASAILTSEQVVEIRAAYRRPSYRRSNTNALASRFGVSPEAILAIVARRSWKHLP